MKTKYYFAYGSNMLSRRIKRRTGEKIRKIGVAKLVGYELKWHKKSRDGSGKCDIVKSESSDCEVFGVLFEILDPSAEIALDEAEGLGRGYMKMEFRVGCGGKNYSAVSYFAEKKDPTFRPYDWYKDLVLEGAKEHKLPKNYISQIESVTANADPELGRKDRLEALEDLGRI